MARMARFKVEDEDSWYHVYSRVAGVWGETPLFDPGCRKKLLDLIQFYCQVYFCRITSFCIMGNHYHMVIYFESARPIKSIDLFALANKLYPNSSEDLKLWTPEKWEQFRLRLFNISEFMRNIQSTFATWYNRNHNRQGRFWSSRFKSTYLESLQAVEDCMLYVDLNPVRANLVERPELFNGSSIFYRENKLDDWLMSLDFLYSGKNRKSKLREYRSRLYYRGSVPTKEGQGKISESILKAEIARGFKEKGMFLRRLRYFVDGIAIGSEAFLRRRLALLRESGRYSRRRHPIKQLDGIHWSLREQRCHVEIQ